MKKKGFTLVELLAVIVVLAIIALIAVPSILGVIDKAKKGALKDSAYGLVDAATLYYAQYGEAARFDFDSDGNVTSNTNNKLGYKGKVENGTVIINSKGQITVCLNDNNNAAYKNYLDNNVIVVDSKTCNVPANTNIIYLDDEATITELDNATLTSKVAELENEIATLNNTIEQQNKAINSIRKLDYENSIAPFSSPIKTGTLDYVAPSDGVLYLVVTQTSRTYTTININGVAISNYALTGASVDIPAADTLTIILNEGDIVTTSSSLSSSNFIHQTTRFVPYVDVEI